MAYIALCVLLATQLALTLGVNQESTDFCESECSVYEEQVYDCAEQAGCFEKEGENEEAYVACYSRCNRPVQLCSNLCFENYGVIKATCNNECENSSECSCLHQQFIGRFGLLLPDLLSPNDTTVSNIRGDKSEDATDSDDSNDKEDSKSSNEDSDADSESSDNNEDGEDSDDDSDSDDSKSDDDDDKKKRSDSSEPEDEDEETEDSDNSDDKDGPDDLDDADDDDDKKKRSDSSESENKDEETEDSDNNDEEDGPDDLDDADDESP